MLNTTPTEDILKIYTAALQAVQPMHLIRQVLFLDEKNLYIAGHIIPREKISRLIIVAAGKAAYAMAKEAELQLGDLISDGICITKYGHSEKLNTIKIIESAHPVPDENSVIAGQKTLALINRLTLDDLVIVLLSGGASSLLADVPAGATLEETQSLFGQLVNSGASIHQINIIRKHISGIKGGQLAKAAYPAKIFTLIISDVPGDDLSSIASGPTVPDPSTFEQAHEILAGYDIWDQTAAPIREYINLGLKKQIAETPKQDDPIFETARSTIIGSIHIALQAAKKTASAMGFRAEIIDPYLTGSTNLEARKLVNQLFTFKEKEPVCLLWGGETTLKVTGGGKGGRNQHFALCALDEIRKKNIQGNHDIILLCAGTDGTDGPTDAAGAVFHSGILVDEASLEYALVNFDSYPFFEKLDCLIKTGPTQTNVMDLVIVLLLPTSVPDDHLPIQNLLKI